MLLHVNRLNADTIDGMLNLFEQRHYTFVALDKAEADQACRWYRLLVCNPAWLGTLPRRRAWLLCHPYGSLEIENSAVFGPPSAGFPRLMFLDAPQQLVIESVCRKLRAILLPR
jgi:hypothetical protein